MTPLIKIRYKYMNKIREMYVKLEMYNTTGSIKDRMANYIIEKALDDCELREGMEIYEATSGNTGISLAAIGARYGFKVNIFMPDWVSIERRKIMEMYGANITLVAKEEGGFKRCIELAKEKAEETGGFLVNQFANPHNVMAHYDTTAMEIIEQMPVKIGGFVSGIGTGGTIMGVGYRLKEYKKKTKIVAVEPDKLPILSKGINKAEVQHKLEGIGDDFIPKIVNKELLDDVMVVNDDDAINMARKLALNLGLGVGISSGANFLGAVMLQAKIRKNIVTIFVDDNKKYISTDLSKEINQNSEFLSNKIQLIDYEYLY